jgi:hypothetical protein
MPFGEESALRMVKLEKYVLGNHPAAQKAIGCGIRKQAMRATMPPA